MSSKSESEFCGLFFKKEWKKWSEDAILTILILFLSFNAYSLTDSTTNKYPTDTQLQTIAIEQGILPKNLTIIDREKEFKESENVIMGVLFAVGGAFLWAVAILSFDQARIISGDVFVTNFLRVTIGLTLILLLGMFQPVYFSGFKKENRRNLKYYIFIGIAGILSLGFADTLFYKAAEINGLIFTTAITINTPFVQHIFSILVLKEKFRKRFLIAVGLIIVGNYIILFL